MQFVAHGRIFRSVNELDRSDLGVLVALASRPQAYQSRCLAISRQGLNKVRIAILKEPDCLSLTLAAFQFDSGD